jgi:hypothetical protein
LWFGRSSIALPSLDNILYVQKLNNIYLLKMKNNFNHPKNYFQLGGNMVEFIKKIFAKLFIFDIGRAKRNWLKRRVK